MNNFRLLYVSLFLAQISLLSSDDSQSEGLFPTQTVSDCSGDQIFCDAINLCVNVTNDEFDCDSIYQALATDCSSNNQDFCLFTLSCLSDGQTCDRGAISEHLSDVSPLINARVNGDDSSLDTFDNVEGSEKKFARDIGSVKRPPLLISPNDNSKTTEKSNGNNKGQSDSTDNPNKPTFENGHDNRLGSESSTLSIGSTTILFSTQKSTETTKISTTTLLSTLKSTETTKVSTKTIPVETTMSPTMTTGWSTKSSMISAITSPTTSVEVTTPIKSSTQPSTTLWSTLSSKTSMAETSTTSTSTILSTLTSAKATTQQSTTLWSTLSSTTTTPTSTVVSTLISSAKPTDMETTLKSTTSATDLTSTTPQTTTVVSTTPQTTLLSTTSSTTVTTTTPMITTILSSTPLTTTMSTTLPTTVLSTTPQITTTSTTPTTLSSTTSDNIVTSMNSQTTTKATTAVPTTTTSETTLMSTSSITSTLGTTVSQTTQPTTIAAAKLTTVATTNTAEQTSVHVNDDIYADYQNSTIIQPTTTKLPVTASTGTITKTTKANSLATTVENRRYCGSSRDPGVVLNMCGYCIGADTGKSITYGFDLCGVCDGQNECLGCDNIPNSKKKVNECGVCEEKHSNCLGIGQFHPEFAFSSGGKVSVDISNISSTDRFNCSLKSNSSGIATPVEVVISAAQQTATVSVPNLPKSKYFLICNTSKTVLKSVRNLEIIDAKDFNLTLIGTETIQLGLDSRVTLKSTSMNFYKKPTETECLWKKAAAETIVSLKGNLIEDKIYCQADSQFLTPGRYRLWFTPNRSLKDLMLNSTNFVQLTLSGPKPELLEARLTDSLSGVLIKFSTNPTGDTLCRNILMATTVAMLGRNSNAQTCYFKGNSLFIRLDKSATLNVSDTLAFKPDSIWTDGADGTLNYSTSNFTKLMAPLNSMKPKFVLYGPNFVNYEDESFTVLILSLVGNGARKMSFTVQVFNSDTNKMLFETFTDETSFDMNVAKTLGLLNRSDLANSKVEVVVVGCNFLFSCTQSTLEITFTTNKTNSHGSSGIPLLPTAISFTTLLSVNGKDRIVGNRQKLVLKTTILPPTKDFIHYFWTCENVDPSSTTAVCLVVNSSRMASLDLVKNLSTGQLTIDKDTLPPSEYLFTANAVVGKTVMHELVSVYVTPGILPQLDIQPGYKAKINHNEQLTFTVKVSDFTIFPVVLEAQILRETGYQYVEIPKNLTCARVTIVEPSGNFTFSCALPPSKSTEFPQWHGLKTETLYKVWLFAKQANGTAQSTAIYHTNAPPTLGTISISPPIGGNALTTQFLITAESDWIDEPSDYPLSYQFRLDSYDKFHNKIFTYTHAKSYESFLSVHLPTAARDTQICSRAYHRLSVEVCDIYGDCEQSQAEPFEVTPPSDAKYLETFRKQIAYGSATTDMVAYLCENCFSLDGQLSDLVGFVIYDLTNGANFSDNNLDQSVNNMYQALQLLRIIKINDSALLDHMNSIAATLVQRSVDTHSIHRHGTVLLSVAQLIYEIQLSLNSLISLNSRISTLSDNLHKKLIPGRMPIVLTAANSIGQTVITLKGKTFEMQQRNASRMSFVETDSYPMLYLTDDYKRQYHQYLCNSGTETCVSVNVVTVWYQRSSPLWNWFATTNPSLISDLFQVKFFDPISGEHADFNSLRHAYEVHIPIPPYFTQFKCKFTKNTGDGWSSDICTLTNITNINRGDNSIAVCSCNKSGGVVGLVADLSLSVSSSIELMHSKSWAIAFKLLKDFKTVVKPNATQFGAKIVEQLSAAIKLNKSRFFGVNITSGSVNVNFAINPKLSTDTGQLNSDEAAIQLKTGLESGSILVTDPNGSGPMPIDPGYGVQISEYTSAPVAKANDNLPVIIGAVVGSAFFIVIVTVVTLVVVKYKQRYQKISPTNTPPANTTPPRSNQNSADTAHTVIRRTSVVQVQTRPANGR